MKNELNKTSDEQLQKLLSSIVVPAKTEEQWAALENDLFLKLDDMQAAKQKKSLFVFDLPRFNLVYACASLIVLCAAGIGINVAINTVTAAKSSVMLASVHGKVAVQWNGQGQRDTLLSIDAKNAQRIAKAGTVFSTLSSSDATIFLDNGSVIKLYENSTVAIKASNKKQQIAFLKNGSILAKVNHRLPNQQFEIQTASANCCVVGTIFRVDALGQKQTTLSVYQGKVRMVPASGQESKTSLVGTGQFLTMTHNKNHPVAGRIAESAMPIKDISVLGMLVEQQENANDRVVDITSQPDGAKVMINNIMVGTTPLLIKKAAGNYSLSIFGDTCEPWEKAMNIGADRVQSISAALISKHSNQQIQHAQTAQSKQKIAGSYRKSDSELSLIPDYVEALVSMSSGEYQTALSILDSLSSSGIIDIKSQMSIMESVNACYKKLGDFEHVANDLEDKLVKAESPAEKGRILWQLANVRGNCLGDYQGAEMSLVEFLILQPDAMWAHNAYSRLAETQYYLKKYESAIETYKKHIQIFPDDPDIDKSMFNLGCILSQDIGSYTQAAGWYSRLLDSFHASKYRSAALFNRAECYVQTGKIREAMKDYKAYLAQSPDGLWRSVCIAELKKNKEL